MSLLYSPYSVLIVYPKLFSFTLSQSAILALRYNLDRAEFMSNIPQWIRDNVTIDLAHLRYIVSEVGSTRLQLVYAISQMEGEASCLYHKYLR